MHKKRKLPPWLGSFLFCFEAQVGAGAETECGNWKFRTKQPSVTMEPRTQLERAIYLPFFVVFFLEDFLVDFFFLAMALVTSFLDDKCKGGQFERQRLFAFARIFFRRGRCAILSANAQKRTTKSRSHEGRHEAVLI